MDDKENRVDVLAKKIWEYMHMHHELKRADCIFVLCSYDTRVATYAADLFLKGYAPYLLFSGGFTEITKRRFSKSEAETFADIATALGVAPEKILIENESIHTADNIECSKKLLLRTGLDFHSFILVQKPFNERRTYATFRKRWPEKECIVTSPQILYEDYPNEEISKDLMINNMIGDFQRIKEYADRGWQVPQDVPDDVRRAYEELVRLGFNKTLVKSTL
jgi:uncharacterized SAM-binding protein YcdF (DUF218 family)